VSKVISICDFIIYWSIILIPFSISISPAFTYSFMGFLFCSFLLKKILKRQRLFVRTAINIPFILLVIISIISFKNSIDLKSSIRGIWKFVEYAMLFLICAEEVRDKKHLGRILGGIICGAVMSSIDGLWQLYSGKDFIRGHAPIINIGLKRATAAFPNANVFGVYVSAIAPVITGMALFAFKGAKKTCMLFFSLLAITGVFLTLSRGTALALYLSVLLIAILKRNKLLTTLLIIFILISPFLLPKNVKNWAKDVNYNPVRFMLNDDRISVYRNTMNMIKHHPFIGVGFSTFPENYLKYKLPEPDYAGTADHMYAHNHYLQMAGETGIIGLSIFIWLLISVFSEAKKIYSKLTSGYLKTYVISLVAGIAAFLINGLTETSLYYSRVSMIFWFMIGLLLSFKRFCSEENG